MIERVLDAIGTIDDELLERVSAARWAAENTPPLRTKKSEKRRLLLWAAGACACLLALTAVLSLLHCRDGRLPEDQEIAVKDSAESKNAAERIAKNTEGETRGTEPALPKSSETTFPQPTMPTRQTENESESHPVFPADPSAPESRETEVQTWTEVTETDARPKESSENETQTEPTEAASRREAVPTEATWKETQSEQTDVAGSNQAGVSETQLDSTEAQSQIRVIWADPDSAVSAGFSRENGKLISDGLLEKFMTEADDCLYAVYARPLADGYTESIRHMLEDIPEAIKYEIEEKYAVLFLSEKDFREIDFPGMEDWVFGLARRESDSERGRR